MPECSQEHKELARYRLEKAREDLEAARLLLGNKSYRAANNRAYYAIFHTMRALLALDGFDSKKHSGIISEFRHRYIKTAIISEDISDMIRDAFEIRNASDYNDMFVASKKETIRQIENATRVYSTIEGYLSDAIGL